MYDLRSQNAAAGAQDRVRFDACLIANADLPAENLARVFWRRLAPAISEGALYEIVLEETEKNSVVYRGEDEQ